MVLGDQLKSEVSLFSIIRRQDTYTRNKKNYLFSILNHPDLAFEREVKEITFPRVLARLNYALERHS